MQTNRFYFLPSFIAAMLLLPSASKLMNTGIFFLLFPVAILLLGVVEKRDLIKNFQRRDLLIYVTVFLLSVIGLILKLSGVLQDQQY
ncbi:MAG: hypothetical protein DBY13_02455, partial [Lachnospiraceae bacterium]